MSDFDFDRYVAGASAKRAPESGFDMDAYVAGANQAPTFTSEANAVMSSLNRGIAAGVGAPVDIVNAGLNMIGLGSEKPFGGSESIKQGMRGIGVDTDRQAETATGRILSKGAEDVGSLVVPYGGATVATKAGMKAGPMINEMVRSPGRQAVAAGSAGVAEGAVSEATDNPWAQLGSNVLGGILGATAPDIAAATARGAKSAVTGAIDPITKRGREKIVGGILRERVVDPGDAIEKLDDLTPKVPGSLPTSGQADSGLATLERGVRSKDAASFAARDAANAQARRDALSDVVPGTDATAENTAIYIQSRLKEFTGAADDIVERASKKAAARLNDLGEGVDAQRAGQILREEFEAAKSATSAGVSRLYNAVDPDDVSKFTTAPLYEEVAGVTNKYFGRSTAGIPAEISAVTERLKAKTMSYADLDAIAKDLGNIQGKAKRAGDNTLESAAGQAKDAVVDYISKNADEGFSPEDAANYQAARAARRDMGQRFEQGAAGKVGATKPFGENTVGDADVPAQFFNSSRGAPDDIDSFIKAMGDKEAAKEALADYAVNNLWQKAVRPDGALDLGLWRKWMKSHHAALKPFPELYAKLRNAKSARNLAERLAKKQEKSVSDFQKSVAGLYLGDLDVDIAVEKTLTAARTNPNEMSRLVGLVKDSPDALDGLRRSVIERALGKAESNSAVDALNNPVVSVDKFRKFLSENRKALARLFTPRQLQTIQAVASDMLKANSVNTAGKIAGSQTSQDLSTAHFLAKFTGGMIDPQNAMANAVTKFVRTAYKATGATEFMDDLLTEAMLDPKLAADLMRKATPDRVEDVMGRIGARIASTNLATQGADVGEPLRIDVRPSDKNLPVRP